MSAKVKITKKLIKKVSRKSSQERLGRRDLESHPYNQEGSHLKPKIRKSHFVRLLLAYIVH